MATAQGRAVGTGSLTTLHWVGVVLAGITGVLHLVLAYFSLSSDPASGLGWAFVVAALGFFGGIAAVLRDYRRPTVYLLGILWTAGQVVAWYAVNGLKIAPIDVTDKVVQVLLIVVLAMLYSNEG
jgi:nicotinamide riboside transporter PnuC